MPPVRSLTVVYDAACGLCTRVKDWIRQQDPLVRLKFVVSGSAEAAQRFPQLLPGELAIVADTGEVWFGNRAWIVCLWALRDYRELAFRLTGPLLSTMAKAAFALVSSERSALSRMLRLRSDRELELELKKVAAPECRIGAG